MTTPENNDMMLAKVTEFETEVERVETKAIAVLNRSELEGQLDAAHKYPRSAAKFLREAATLATLDEAVAASCIYTLPRAGKSITGPSVRLAEICASAWGNLHIGARVIDVEDKEVVAQGIAWDLERNLRVTIESRRRITNKQGKRYDDDMITMTGNAAASIALRNAIFRVVPRAFVDTIYAKAREVAVGTAKTLEHRRQAVVANFGKLGVPAERVFERVGKKAIEDIGLEDLEVLIGLGTAIRDGNLEIEAAFPVDMKPVGDVKSLEEKLRGKETPAAAAPAATAPPAKIERAESKKTREPGEEG